MGKKSKMKACKVCENMVAKSAKTCPYCGAKLKSGAVKIVVCIIILIVGICLLISGFVSLAMNDMAGGKSLPDEIITMEEYNAIEMGMTYEEVVAIIGGEGELLSAVDLYGIKTEMYAWEGELLGANANVTFYDGEVFSKAQLALE